MDVADSIKQLRASAGITQEELGRIAGVSSMAVSQWENRRAVPRMQSIQKIADYFGVPKSLIMGDRNSTIDGTTVEERALLVLFRSCSNRGRTNILEYAEDTARRHPKSDTDTSTIRTA